MKLIMEVEKKERECCNNSTAPIMVEEVKSGNGIFFFLFGVEQ